MRRFLQETWELFYWALWCPSRLFRDDTDFRTHLLFEFHLRFFNQFLIIISCLSLPLVLTLIQQNQAINWLLLPIVWFIAYGIACWYLPSALPVPLIVWWSYVTQPDLWLKGVNEALTLLSPLPALSSGVGIGAMGLGITAATGYMLLQNNQVLLWHIVFVVGSTLSSGLGSWVVTQNWIFTIFVGGTIAFTCSAIQSGMNDVAEYDADVLVGSIAGVMAVGIGGILAGAMMIKLAGYGGVGFAVVLVAGIVVVPAVGIALGLAGVIAVGIAVGIAVVIAVGIAVSIAVVVVVVVVSIPQLPLTLFLLTGALLAASLSHIRDSSWYLFLGVVFLLIWFEQIQTRWQVIWLIPAVLVGYYRILPDYIVLLVLQLPSTLPFVKRFFASQPQSQLYRLPPYSSEILWLPLPGHVQLLASAFRQYPQAALSTFQKMQESSLPGFQQTLQKALPYILADQLAAIQTIAKLQHTASPQHPLLPLLVPTFYQSEPTVKSSVIALEISTMLPRLQNVAKDVGGVLEASNAALRERGLERILTNLTTLQMQLPGLGLRADAIQRWEPVIIRWQTVLELELEEQRKQSQGELLNPFQFGNPLRQERSSLFKGRRAFVDQVYRLVLDRNRPTLVLHGPRRCGKSSFLLNLSRLLPSDLVPVYLDMQRAGISNSEADFCYGLVKAIHDDSRSQGIVLPAFPKRAVFYQRPYPMLEDWLDEALPSLGNRRLLLNLDEFEKIGSAIQSNRISFRLFDELRSLIQHSDQLGFLFSGVQTLDELGPNWSSYFISVVPMEMLYLEPNEAEELLLNPDPEFALRYNSGIVSEILRLTRCQPYLLQLIGSTLVTQANLEHTQLVTFPMLEAAIQDAFTQGEPYFTNVWDEFTGTTPSEIAAGQAYLLSLAGRTLTPPNLSLPNIQAAIRRLRRYHVIEQVNGSDCIEIPLFEQWVHDRAIAD